MTVALVLSGGGARGDFEVGAVQYLYETGMRPEIICTTSVGSINGLKLAEGEVHGPNRGLRGLVSIWLSLQDDTSMWEEEKWLTNIANSKVKSFLKQEPWQMAGAVGLEGVKYYLFAPWAIYDLIQTGIDIVELKDGLEKASKAKSLYNLNPIREKLRKVENLALNLVQASGIRLRMAIVGLESGALRYVTESGQILEKNLHTQALNPIQALAPACQRIADDIAELEAKRIVALNKIEGAKLSERITPEIVEREAEATATLAAQVSVLSDQIAQKRLAFSTCIEAHPSTTSPQTVNLLEATMASASIPFAFPPVKLGLGRPEYYVDGGVREVIPIQAAIDAGADEVLAVVASATGVPPATTFPYPDKKPLDSFDNGNLLDIAWRVANDIMPDETSVNETDPLPTGWGLPITIIQPNFDIHDIMTIDPGLIRIRMAHGYMRADDVLQAKRRDPSRYREVADQFSEERKTNQIIQLRKQIWDLENLAHGIPALIPFIVSKSLMLSARPAVRQMKRDLMDLVNKRRDSGGAVPAGADSWSQDWEKHTWAPMLSLWTESAGDPMGYVGAGGEARVVYRGNDDHIHELFLSASRTWSAADLFTVNVGP